MNIDINSKLTTNTTTVNTTTSSSIKPEETPNFAQELTDLSELNSKEAEDNKSKVKENSKENLAENSADIAVQEEISENNITKQGISEEQIEPAIANKTPIIEITANKLPEKKDNNIDTVIDGLQDAVAQINQKLTQPDEKSETELKTHKKFSDNLENDLDKSNKKDDILINNDMNINPEKTDALTFQMGANMNFNSDGQPFAELMNNQEGSKKLAATATDLAEEKAILSSMDENIAIAERNKAAIQQNNIKPIQEKPAQAIAKPSKVQEKPVTTIVQPVQVQETEVDIQEKVKTVTNNQGVKKVDTKTNVTIEMIVKYDSVIMDKNDVEFFVNLVEQGQVDAAQVSEKSSKVSKTLADLIAKSMKDNQPVRIDFDNNISVIIKISKDGKISADFLPSSQIAEAYLKENLPLLRQKFDDNNIEYDELNHRKQKQDEKDNQKKGQKDE